MNGSTVLAKAPARTREDQIQFLRFLAFLNIYIAHGEVYLFFPYPASHCAAAAVSFFFILSGALAGFSGVGKEIRLNVTAIGSYLWRKIRKLYPLYFVTMMFCVVFSNIFGLIAAEGIQSVWPFLRQLLRNLLLIQSWFPEGYFSINGVAWFLSTLMFLYLWTLPGLWVLNKLRRHKWFYLELLMLLGGILFTIAAYCYATQSYNMDFLQYILPPARLGEYLAGMVLGFGIASFMPLLREWKGKRWSFTVLEMAALAFWFFSLGRPGNYWMNRSVSGLIPNLAVTGIFLVGMGKVSELFRWKPLVRLGDVSFACFLIHNIVLIRFQQYNVGMEATYLGCILGFVVCLVFTLMISFLVSKPGKS